jgi:hypothetical protein
VSKRNIAVTYGHRLRRIGVYSTPTSSLYVSTFILRMRPNFLDFVVRASIEILEPGSSTSENTLMRKSLCFTVMHGLGLELWEFDTPGSNVECEK